MKLVFDFGAVLVDLEKSDAIAAFDRLGVDIRPYIGTFRQGGVFALLENGDISLSDFYDEMRKIANNPALTNDEIRTAWEAYLKSIPAERLQLLLKIRQHYEVYALSNTNVIHWTQSLRDFFTWKGHTVNDFFDGLFLSYELHAQKPDPAIFQKVTDALHCAPSEILFFDDSETNCEAAEAFGWNALLAPAGGEWLKYFDDNGRLRD